MAWRAYFDSANGRLVSVGTVWPETAPPGFDFVGGAESAPPSLDSSMWDEATRRFIARPAKVLVDRLDDIITDSRYSADLITLWNALNATNRNRLRNGLIRLLGSQRFRAQGEAVEL